ncbi:MAG TPA: type II toxin-antitoxin system VapB family antitoxin [Longimicrobium sp.]|jgi:Arc/MetJ family transcription regulator
MPRSALRGNVPRDAAEKPAIRRKNLNIDQNKLDRAVKILGAHSETEAVDRALDLLVFREDLLEGIRRIGGTGGVENFFDEHL